jgi:hypothetical protein
MPQRVSAPDTDGDLPPHSHPRDLVEAVVDAARYEGKTPILAPETVDEACHTYFVKSKAP